MNADLVSGQQLIRANRFDLAEPRIRRALVAEPDNASAHALLSMCLVARKAIGGAIAEAHESIRLAPSKCFGHAALGSAELRRGRWKAAEAAIREAIRLDPLDQDHRAQLSFVLMNRHRPHDALQVAEQGLAIEPTNVGCLNSRALALVSLGRIDEARLSINSALASSPTLAVLHSNLAMVLLQAGRADDALDESLEALRLDPTLGVAQQNLRASERAAGKPLFGPTIRLLTWWRRQPLWERLTVAAVVAVTAVLMGPGTTTFVAILSIPVALGWLWRRAPDRVRASRPYRAAAPIIRLSPLGGVFVVWLILLGVTLNGLYPPHRASPISAGGSLSDGQVQTCLFGQVDVDLAAAAAGIDLARVRARLLDANPPPSDLAQSPVGPNAAIWLRSVTANARGEPDFMFDCAVATYRYASAQPP